MIKKVSRKVQEKSILSKKNIIQFVSKWCAIMLKLCTISFYMTNFCKYSFMQFGQTNM